MTARHDGPPGLDGSSAPEPKNDISCGEAALRRARHQIRNELQLLTSLHALHLRRVLGRLETGVVDRIAQKGGPAKRIAQELLAVLAAREIEPVVADAHPVSDVDHRVLRRVERIPQSRRLSSRS